MSALLKSHGMSDESIAKFRTIGDGTWIKRIEDYVAKAGPTVIPVLETLLPLWVKDPMLLQTLETLLDKLAGGQAPPAPAA